MQRSSTVDYQIVRKESERLLSGPQAKGHVCSRCTLAAGGRQGMPLRGLEPQRPRRAAEGDKGGRCARDRLLVGARRDHHKCTRWGCPTAIVHLLRRSPTRLAMRQSGGRRHKGRAVRGRSNRGGPSAPGRPQGRKERRGAGPQGPAPLQRALMAPARGRRQQALSPQRQQPWGAIGRRCERAQGGAGSAWPRTRW